MPELIERVRNGSDEALAELFRARAPFVHAVAWRLLQAADDAEDVVQDVFVGLPRALRTYRGSGSFEGWLRRITVRVCLMRMRSRRRRGEEPLDARSDLSRRDGTSAALNRVALSAALARLPEPQRTVFVLKVVEGYSHEEIAAMLDISVEASRARLSRARSELRSFLIE